MSAARSIVSVLLALQYATDEPTAEAMIERLGDPFLRKLVRKEWREFHERSVVTLDAS